MSNILPIALSKTIEQSAVTGEIRAGNKYQFTLANTDVDYNDTNYSIPVLEDKSQVTLTINTVV